MNIEREGNSVGIENRIQFLDGAMGTQLQAKGLPAGASPELFMMEHGEVIEEVHAAYIDSGSDIIYTNTFGANAKKLSKSQYTVEDIITRAVQLAKSAAKRKAGVRVALDIGPIGEMLEPNGYLPFEEAYELYRQQVVAGEQAGADLVIFETMSDLYEVKAAMLAAKEHTQLPVFVTMSFEADYRTFTGCTTASFALCAEGLGADAIGINCSLGPDQILPIAEELAAMTNLPLIIKANAGLPDPITNTYSIDAAEYARMLLPYTKLPLAYVGGCCGTTPQFIRELRNVLPKAIAVEKQKRRSGSYACTPTKCLRIQDVHVIGERINPTGNKRMKAALQEHRLDEILAIAMEEVEGGADILDVNVGLPGINEKEMMVEVIKELQSVIDLPLQIDSTDPAVIQAALRVVNGVAIVNSVNGEAAVMERILPAVKKYGANVVGLTMDEDGIPESAQKRLKIGARIVETAQLYGIAKENVFLDCLTLTVSAQQSGAKETLKALRAIRQQLGVHTVLGVSNISFGLPSRILLNQSFLTMAMQAGLSMPIMNPNQPAMMAAVRSYRVLQGIDADSQEYIRIYAQQKQEVNVETGSSHMRIEESIMRGLKEETRQLCTKLLTEKEPLQIVNEHLIPALDAVGVRYEKKEIYLPQLINAATASQCAFEEIRRAVNSSGMESISKGKIILATVKGDVHDIGKNIVKVVLENYGYQVFDLGKDVPIEAVVETAIKEQVRLIGLSALMTTTLKSMEDTIQALHDSGHDCKIMVGGAVVSAEYAKQIHADYYARDAKESADIAKEVLG
ncbi:homocysteine S-methyltransferase family protein [[Clostridium] innocuum]|uniref:homocysteine S-methyltransferase family protein n=3 Tax=Bacillota TaxID=1239 RepID=UPI001E2E2F5D|nr:homocysteine S-methyltransferase family protein [[Clostridium] innocuum]MCC2846939.1 homocysteine S-methyltransferase family protein [[Clostridium] innocuum]MCC2851074.1 homocysteine S-methyltransferase family protein [[Clostridium] innocuum]MCC2855163.1 homocysteine S-methyltransferase family protein [[Clostridium] innocuum]MCG4662930.1 homocysteine S-methyltransferase family protein [[Clostridium] innocuum]MCR0332211.1 homocysteine S-methyltransferase family protein [[Clostridium] innocuu